MPLHDASTIAQAVRERQALKSGIAKGEYPPKPELTETVQPPTNTQSAQPPATTQTSRTQPEHTVPAAIEGYRKERDLLKKGDSATRARENSGLNAWLAYCTYRTEQKPPLPILIDCLGSKMLKDFAVRRREKAIAKLEVELEEGETLDESVEGISGRTLDLNVQHIEQVDNVFQKVAPEFSDLIGATKAQETLAETSVGFLGITSHPAFWIAHLGKQPNPVEPLRVPARCYRIREHNRCVGGGDGNAEVRPIGRIQLRGRLRLVPETRLCAPGDGHGVARPDRALNCGRGDGNEADIVQPECCRIVPASDLKHGAVRTGADDELEIRPRHSWQVEGMVETRTVPKDSELIGRLPVRAMQPQREQVKSAARRGHRL